MPFTGSAFVNRNARLRERYERAGVTRRHRLLIGVHGMLLFCDSFDHYHTSTLGQKYLSVSTGGDSVATIVSGGREGGNCLQLPGGGYVSQACQNPAQLIVGFALNPSAFGGSAIVSFYDMATLQGQLRLTVAGGLEYYDGDNNLLASSANAIVDLNSFSYIEVNVLFSTTATGTVSAQVNGESAFSVTAKVTSLSGNNQANIVQIVNGGTYNPNYLYDDLYICDATGTINNNFLGDVAVMCLFPNGDGQYNEFSQVGGTSGDNWTSVDDNPATLDPCPDGDTTYVYSSTTGNQDFYAIQPVGSPQAIVAVQIVASARKDDSFSRVLALGFGNGTTSVFDAGFSLGSNYVMYTQPYDEDPITSAAWDISHLDNGQIGIQILSS